MSKNKIWTLGLLFGLLITVSLISVKCKKDEPIPVGETIVSKMVDRNKIPLVQATLNGKPALFILDTGATISIIDINQTDDFGIINEGESEGTTVVGYGGSENRTYDLRNVNVRTGDTKFMVGFQGKDIKTIVDVVKKYNNRKIVGIIGNDNISDRNLILNFRTGNITK